MTKSRAELDADLNALEAWMPTMLEQTDEACQMDAFAARAEAIEDQAGPGDTAYVHERLQRLLVTHCLIPSDEGPCA